MRHTPTSGGRACGVLLALVVGAACGAARTGSRVETPPSTNMMSGYETYSWWRAPLNEGPRGYSDDEERLDLAVRLIVERELTARGYHGDNMGRPDFVVRYGVALYREATPSFREYLSYGADGKDMGAGPGAPAGTFTLEAIDAATRRVAWRATAPAVFEHGPSENPVTPTVSRVMESFPHRP